jgi:hypothetical protein
MRFRRVVVCAAIPLLGLWAIAVSLPASARPIPKNSGASAVAQARTKSAVGTYAYSDSFGVTDESLVISEGGTVALGSSCAGLWVQSGTIFTMDIDANCSVTVGTDVYTLTAIFSGTIGRKGLSSAQKPGAMVLDDSSSGTSPGTWYAVKGGTSQASSAQTFSAWAMTSPDVGKPRSKKAGGDYGFFDQSGDSNLPLTLNTDGTLTISNSGTNCTGLWVQSGAHIAMDLNTSSCGLFVFAAPVSARGLASEEKPGNAEFNGAGTETWYALASA